MVNNIPSSWIYNNTLENMLFFYQYSEELLSFNSPDSFRLPVCNSMTLVSEIYRIYMFLYNGKQIERYYSKYIPCILDELIKSISEDKILKNLLGFRLDSITKGLDSAKLTPTELLKWINLIKQICTIEQHANLCKNKIIEIIKSANNEKMSLSWCTQNFYIDLISIGYNPEYLYQSIIRFFDNRDTPINTKDNIVTFFENFNYKNKDYKYYIVADTYMLNNFSKINPQFDSTLMIQELDETEIVSQKKLNGRIRRFYETYEDLRDKGVINIKMLSCQANNLDPYSAFNDISHSFDLAQCFEGYFKHKSEQKIVFDILLNNEGYFIPIKPRKTIPSRPYIDQTNINRRIEAIINSDNCSIDVILSLVKAMDMHLDALNCKNAETMLRTFWIALETLFFNSEETSEKESVKYCLLNIIQKTYILKQFRLIYNQMINAITEREFWIKIGVADFKQFVKKFMSVTADDEGFKEFTSYLTENPLLRSRIYWFRKELSSCESILNKIENHNLKVSWHIDRIYRTRNISTHAGIMMPYMDDILFNIHNYFDYVINYIICKLENGEYIHNISTTVFEAKNDNLIHMSILKKNGCITEESNLYALFGPDIKITDYNFEVIVSDE